MKPAPKISVFAAWELCFPNPPTRCGVYKSPFRHDKTPSFSIFDGGGRWHDHATGEGGDAYEFVKLAKSCDFAEAKRILTGEAISKVTAPIKISRNKEQEKPDPALYRSLVQKALRDDRAILEFLKSKVGGCPVAATYRCYGDVGSLGPWPAFIYEDGIKVRFDPKTSRSCRWVVGSHGNKPWRMHKLRDPEVTTVLMFEGETDLLYANSKCFDNRHVAYIAAPSASWKPDEAFINEYLKGRSIVTAFDNDDAGDLAAAWWKENCGAKQLKWQKLGLPRGKDFRCLGTAVALKVLRSIHESK